MDQVTECQDGGPESGDEGKRLGDHGRVDRPHRGDSWLLVGSRAGIRASRLNRDGVGSEEDLTSLPNSPLGRLVPEECRLDSSAVESRTTDPIKLLYVLGAGRSGSTTLGVALDNVPGVFNTGELFSWFIFQAKPTSDRPTTVEFWGRVRERLTSLESHFGTQYHMGLEHPYSIFGSKRWSGEFKRAHLDANAELIKTVAEERGESLIADTSHYPMRLGRLLKLDPKEIDVHSIYLVRDPRMVMNALRKTVQRHRPMHPLKAVAYC